MYIYIYIERESNHGEKNYCFLNSIKLSEYKIGIKFDKDLLAVKQKNYLSRIVNVYVVYELYNWPRNLLTISNLKIYYLEQLV